MRGVEADEQVLDLLAARPVDVADQVERREAHGEEIRAAALAERHLIDRPSAIRSRYSSANGERVQRVKNVSVEPGCGGASSACGKVRVMPAGGLSPATSSAPV